ncbi:portal protein [Ancylobacter sp.]|uniref:portal protein n=1 Tax=Ancylobacter sp. TaxID=1872567 RepID=UPI003C79AB91
MARKVLSQKPIRTDGGTAAYLNNRFQSAYDATNKVRETRRDMLEYYRQEMDHIPSNEGESQITTAEVRDVIETLLPQMLEPFMTSEGAGVFEPNNDDDVEQAKLETAYTQHVMFTQNRGFELFVAWVKDGLLQKNGYVKAWWNTEAKVVPESYQGLSLDEADKVTADAGNILQIAVRGFLPTGKEIPSLEALATLPPEMVQAMTVNIDLVREDLNEQVRIAAVAPENIVVEEGYTKVDLSEARYVAERIVDKTRGELKAMGYDPALVDKLSTISPQLDDPEAKERASNQGTSNDLASPARGDDAIVEVREHYIRTDLDNSGIIKLWKVCTGGAGSSIVLSQELVSRIPYHAWTPIIAPHQHHGGSAAELVNDLQDIHTVLWRQSLNSVVASNRQRPVLNENNTTEDTFNDLMQTVPGHPVRVRGNIADSLQWTAPPNTGTMTLPIMEYLQGMLEARTGLSKQAAGLDSQALADSTNMMGAMIMSQSLLRVKMMLRTFAETGVRSLMEHVRELVMKNEKRERMFEFMGKYVAVNPTDWRTQRNTVIKVGLGYADRLEKIASLNSAYNVMKEVVGLQGGVDGPLVSLENAYNVLQDLLVAQGLVTKGRYLTDPVANPPEPQPPSPTAIDVAEAELVSKNAIEEAKLKADVQKHQTDTKVKVLEIWLQDVREREKLQMQSFKTLAEIEKMVTANDNEQDRGSQPSANAA